VRTDKEVGGKDGKTLLSDKAIFLSAKCLKAQLAGMRKRAGRKEYKEKDREDGGRMVKR
jgi:hypothetical protein